LDWLHSLAGFGTGVLVGLTGVGGGALMTPMLVLLFGVAPAAAVGTDLWFAALTKLVGGASHQSRGSIDWQVLRRLSLGSLPAAVLTLAWMHLSGAAQLRQGLLLQMLGLVLLLTAAAMLLRSRTHAWGRRLRTRVPEAFKRAQPVLTVAAGAVLGVLVTLTSIGAGALGVVILLYLYPLRMTPARLVGTDIVHAVPLTIVAGLGHLWMGHVDFGLLGQLLLGSVPGVLIGAHFSTRIRDDVLRPAIAVVLIAVGVKLGLG
jgi:uncharacterized membrane protein YfcA